MKVVEKVGKEKEDFIEEDAAIMLTNKKGGYALFSHQPKSRYEGVFFSQQKMYKVISSLLFASPVAEVTNLLWAVERLHEDGTKELLFYPEGYDAFVVELNKISEFDLVLDCKESYDNRSWGRNYEIEKEKGCLVVRFSKKNDNRDDNSVNNEEYDIYVAAYSPELEYMPIREWIEEHYSLDKQRKDSPFSRWVFRACKLKAKEIVFAFSNDKEKAIVDAKYVFNKKPKLKSIKEASVGKLINQKKIKDEEIDLAYKCALNSLDSLRVGDQGVYAGLPWFFQFWARDELVSTKAFMLIKDYAFVKSILFRYLGMISAVDLSSASLPTKGAKSHLSSADALGWLFVRLHDFIKELDKQGIRKKYISRKEEVLIEEKAHQVLSIIAKYHLMDGLIHNGPKETWMDTEWQGKDARDGFRIEIQALTLAICKLLKALNGSKESLEAGLKREVRKYFFNEGYLYDGKNDSTIRPNVFIAAYVYSELLSKKEWIECFEKMLPKLWLKWGGLASIDKTDKLFTDRYTGIDNKSYHRGDSWFWVNNLAAIVLHRLDAKKFDKYIKKILGASADEILYEGATGHHAEISSAKQLKGEGCLAQAWSNAMFIELIDEIFQ